MNLIYIFIHHRMIVVIPPHESHVYAISVSDYPSADLLNDSEAELYHRMNVSSYVGLKFANCL